MFRYLFFTSPVLYFMHHSFFGNKPTGRVGYFTSQVSQEWSIMSRKSV